MNWEQIKQEAAAVVQAEFGEPIRFQYLEGHLVDICAKFTMATTDVSMGGQVPISSRQPMCNIRKGVLERKPRQGDLIIRRSVTYEVKAVEVKLDASFDVLLLVVDARHAAHMRDRT
ncbi:hypothetical protein [uncultured Variovorax sp.]|jgi:hypothetical protein|uniref:head-tail joining protein n=1 Tax=uncultured Variovorax sp. TaxID=114708 RepID=UPI0026307359|nr:hypothetical protein [uncultured Variovorax sp.]